MHTYARHYTPTDRNLKRRPLNGGHFGDVPTKRKENVGIDEVDVRKKKAQRSYNCRRYFVPLLLVLIVIVLVCLLVYHHMEENKVKELPAVNK